MENFLVMDFFVKLFYAIITLIVFWLVLRFRDKLTGVKNFKKAFQGVQDEPVAYAMYLGGTAIAVSIVISSFF